MRNGSLKILIADDEAPARSRLIAMVNDIGGWNVVAEASSGNRTLERCQQQQPDVVLLDIRMPEMDGLEVAAHLCAMKPPPAVIFTTAYDEYAVNAFETHAVGYLLKPVRRERLLRALEHAARVSRMQLADLAKTSPELGARHGISVSEAGGLRLIPLNEIVSFHADQKYVRMVHTGGETLIDESLKSLEQEFSRAFVRVHRNSLVSIAAIEALEKDTEGQYLVRLRGAGPCAVSRRHVSALKTCLS